VHAARSTALIAGIATTAALGTIGALTLTTHAAVCPPAVAVAVAVAACCCWMAVATTRVLDWINRQAERRAGEVKAHTDARLDAVMEAFYAVIERYGDDVATDTRLAERRELAKPGGGRFALVD
jgi:hypothetical protein